MKDPFELDLGALGAFAPGAASRPGDNAALIARARGRAEVVGTIDCVRHVSSREQASLSGAAGEGDPEGEVADPLSGSAPETSAAATAFVVAELIERVEHEGTKKEAVIVGMQRSDLPLTRGVAYVFLGVWDEHPKHGLRFRFDAYSRSEPESFDAMMAYARDALSGIGLGPRTLERVWAVYGHEALHRLADAPEEVSRRCSVRVEVCNRAAEQLSEDRQSLRTRLALYGLLAGRGFPSNLIELCMLRWGAAAPDLIRSNPFVLLESDPRSGRRFSGCSFGRVDAIYNELGLDPDDPSRAAWCAWDVVNSDREGHTWIRKLEVRANCLERLGIGTRASVGAIDSAIDRRLLVLRDDAEGTQWVALRHRAFNEASIVRSLSRLRLASPRWPDPAALLGLYPHQREQLARAFSSSVAIVAGSAGTGKTTTAMVVVAALYRMGVKVAVCGPTGRAAVRCTELLRKAGIDDWATTIHKLLGYGQMGTGQYLHGPDNPLDYQVVVVDEMSMADTNLFASLLRAMPKGAHLMLVGDPNQLSPVGHGAPLRDLIDAGWPCAMLSEIHRNAGRIAEAARQIRDGEKLYLPEQLDLPFENLRHFQCSNPDAILPLFRQLLQRLAAQHASGARPWHPIDDVQVIVPRNVGGQLARQTLNLVCQHELNGRGRKLERCPFRVGDKVIGLRNGNHRVAVAPLKGQDREQAVNWAVIDLKGCNDQQERLRRGYVYVANGDVGRVLAVSLDAVIVQFSAPDRLVRVQIRPEAETDGDSPSDDDGEAGDSYLSLGYVVTAHKFQGAQNRVVIVLIDPDRRSGAVASKQWVYTGLTRGQEVVLTIGDRAVIEAWLTRDQLRHRKTFLAHDLRSLYA